MIRQNCRQGKEPRFAALLNRSNLNSFTPSKRRDSDSQYDVNQSRRPQMSRNTSSDRLAASPLKGPLKKAIQKTVKNISNKQNEISTSRRILQSKVSKKYDNDEDLETIIDQMHSQTQNFLWKYFDPARFHQISMGKFVDKIMNQYQNLWSSQQSEQILEPFIDKLVWSIGGDQIDWVDIKLLQMETNEAGIIGLILKIFKQLKYEGQRSIPKSHNYSTLKQSFEDQLQESSDIQNIKNIVQEFMESMYKCMQNQVYAKFNVQMRRMVLRYKESQKLLKIVNDKITNNIDIFTNDQKYNEKIRQLQAEIESYRNIQQQHEIALNRQKDECRYFKSSNDKLLDEVRRLNDELNKIQSYNIRTQQSILQPRASTVSYVDPLVSRYTSDPHIYGPTVVQQIQKSVVKNTYSDFYDAPLTKTTIQNTSSIIPTNVFPAVQVTYPSLVSVTQPEVKVQVIQQKEYISTSPSRSVIRAQTIPASPSRLTISRLEASPIRSRVVQIL